MKNNNITNIINKKFDFIFSMLLYSIIVVFFVSIIGANQVSAAGFFNASPKYSLTDGLVGYWTFDGKDTQWTSATAATTLDKSGNGNTGTLTNMNRATSPTAGKVGQGLRFDGVDDYVSTTLSGTSATTNVTFSAWVYPRVFGEYACIFCTRITGFKGMILTSTVNNYSVTFGWDGDEWVLGTGMILQLNKWNFVTFVITSNSANGYLYNSNGLITYSNSNPNASRDFGGLWDIAKDPNFTTRNFNGSIDDVRIYNRALSATEIGQLYNLGSAKFNASPKYSLTDGLVGYWTFDGKDTPWTSATAATTLDKSGNGKTGTLTNMNRATSPVVGKVGQGLKFDGSDDYVLTSSINFSSTFSVGTWVKPTGTQGTYTRIIETSYINSFYLGTNADGTSYEVFVNDSIIAKGVIGGTIQNKWTHLLLTYDGTTLRLYVNGISVGTPTTPAAPAPVAKAVTIGRLAGGAGYNFSGTIDDVRIYNRALSATEVRQLYNMGR